VLTARARRGCRPLPFKRSEKLFHLVHSPLSSLGRADFPSATQDARLLHQVVPVSQCSEVHPRFFRPRLARRGYPASCGTECSLALCSHIVEHSLCS